MSCSRLIALASLLCVGLAANVYAAGISVGSSSLIGTPDYSDTFTAGINSRVAGEYPIADPVNAAKVENCCGNAARSWTLFDDPSFGSIVDDSTVVTGAGYPGSSNAGSATGFTQRGIGGDMGIAYDLRTNYVVQFDAVQGIDRMNVTTGSANDTFGSPNGLSVFFRPTGNACEIGLYNSSVGEAATGLLSGVASPMTWHNYAVHFDLDAGSLAVYTDEALCGTVDLKTFNGGQYWNIVDATTNDYVCVGGNTLGIAWSDNFQVGAAVPEPAAATMTVVGLFGLLAYAWRKRK